MHWPPSAATVVKTAPADRVAVARLAVAEQRGVHPPMCLRPVERLNRENLRRRTLLQIREEVVSKSQIPNPKNQIPIASRTTKTRRSRRKTHLASVFSVPPWFVSSRCLDFGFGIRVRVT